MGQPDRLEGVLIMISDYLLLGLPALPLVLALLLPLVRSNSVLLAAPLFACLSAFMIPLNTPLHLPWILTGVHWQLDQTGQLMLFFSAVIWLLASLYIIFEPDRQTGSVAYRSLFLLAMAGNMVLMVAADMSSFYLGFALMGLAAYGLIVKPSQRARHAARIYLSFTLAGELALFIAMVILFAQSGSTLFVDVQQHSIPNLAVAFLLLGFGIKLALPGLHFWLPMTYSSAPLISVAILSGPMMNAGLLGWIRFLPPGTDNLQTWGGVLIWIGIAGVILGSILALLQKRAEVILAYSSIAKMGFASSIFGYALANPEQAEEVIAALVLFAVHHLLVKSALFIGTYEHLKSKRHHGTYLGLIALSLTLTGFIYSAGSGIKQAIVLATENSLQLLLVLSGFFTALMMLHFLWTIKNQAASKPPTNHGIQSAFNPYLAWWLLIPIAWFAPFTPTALEIRTSSLLLIGSALLAYLYLKSTWRQPGRLPLLFRAGDLLHLGKRLRLTNPIIIKPYKGPLELFKWPQHIAVGLPGNQSLSVPGMLWFCVLALLGISFFITPE
jgi:formate hydrogenlyase subunit 3/multisubunit Na+/H+ antiporter MnhD subunit